MSRARPIITSFGGGIWSPRLDGRVDLEAYRTACKEATNFQIYPQGAAQNRSGSKFIAQTKNNGLVRQIPFIEGDNKEYALEFGDEYIRFGKDREQITGGAKFYSVGGGATQTVLLFSEDGNLPWDEATASKSVQLNSIAFNDGLYVAVGESDGTDSYIITSNDGLNWTERTSPVNVGLNKVYYINNQFVVVGDVSGGVATVLTSTDGETWIAKTNPPNVSFFDIAFNGTTYVACPGVADIIYYSTDLDNWSTASITGSLNPLTTAIDYNRVVWSAADSKFVILGEGNISAANRLITTSSTDGINWPGTDLNFHFAGGITPKIMFHDETTGLYILFAYKAAPLNAVCRTSPDGTNWATRTVPGGEYGGIAYGNGQYVMAGTPSHMVTSPDGATWTQSDNFQPPSKNDIIFRDDETIEIVSPYAEADLFDIQVDQTQNIMYLTHESYAPRKLTRLADDSWFLEEVDFTQKPLTPFLAKPAAVLRINTVDTGINNWIKLNAEDEDGNAVSVFRSADIGKIIVAGSGKAIIRYLLGNGSATGAEVVAETISGFNSTQYAIDAWSIVGGGIHNLNPSGTGAVGNFINLVNDTVIDIVNDLISAAGATWTASGTGSMYYLTGALIPALEPGDAEVLEKGQVMTKDNAGVAGGLSVGEWGWGDVDAIGSNTLYVRLTDDVDPDTYRTGTEGDRRHWLVNIVAGVTPIVTAYLDSDLVDEVGGYISIQGGIGKITANIDTRTYQVQVVKVLESADATLDWVLSEEAWSAALGYPGAIVFHEDRLYFAGSTTFPLTLWGSIVGAYESFIEGINDADALNLTLNARETNKILWLESRDILIGGTEGGEWQIGLRGQLTTPTNVYARRQTKNGSDIRYPIVAQNNILFVERGNRKLRELTFAFESDSYIAPDRMISSESLTSASTIKQLAYQPRDLSIVWALLNAGNLLGMTYEPFYNIFAWHQHATGMTLAGAYDGTDVIESICVIADSNGKKELWASIKRVVNGGTIRTIEVFDNLFDSDTASEARMLDCYLVDTSLSTTVSGLDHLIGDTVTFIIDGDSTKIGTAVVDGSGEIDISGVDTPTVNVVVGIPYTATLRTMRVEGGGERGSVQGKIKRIYEYITRLYRTMGGKVGSDSDNLESIKNVATLTTDDRTVKGGKGYEKDGIITVVQEQPLPITVTAILPEIDESEK